MEEGSDARGALTGSRGLETTPGGERVSKRDRNASGSTGGAGASSQTSIAMNPRLSKGAAMVERARKEREMCTKTEMTPLMIAAARGHDDIVKVLLNHGATS